MADHRGNTERHYLHTRLPFTHAQPDCNAFVALGDPATQTEPLEILRGLTERVEVQATENTFAIEFLSEIAKLIRLSAGAESLAKEPYRSSVMLVAGESNQRYLQAWRRRIPREWPG